MKTMLLSRAVSKPGWWIFGIAMLAAAWWGQPLVDSAHFENHFFGVFWYSMIVLGLMFWVMPAEQYTDGTILERRIMLLGLVPVWKKSELVSAFEQVELTQEPNVFGKDSVWLSLINSEDGEISRRFVFAYFPASQRGIAKAQQMAGDLSQISGLPFAQAAAEV
ncbi:hypothetical protein [Iodobacter ciconiae]|uniref:Uncharacterized protein n=1 Tax=Iodobacter ciconiae TaxID=2496266 RepID=A0A3S8ZUI7_9NEIS|nr:hypothetical protein [Iodobacter ciconiae]AZN37104.1 hypothetical protein EJO50_11820 [Iodobacter ciconiae]